MKKANFILPSRSRILQKNAEKSNRFGFVTMLLHYFELSAVILFFRRFTKNPKAP